MNDWNSENGNGRWQTTLERTNTPRLVMLVGLLVLTLIGATCTGCATVEQWTDDHPQVVPVASLVVLTAGGIALGKGIAKSGRTQVIAQPRRMLGPL